MTKSRDLLGITFALGAALFILQVLAQGLGLLPMPGYLPYLSLAVPLLAIPLLKQWEEARGKGLPWTPVVLLAAFAIALAVRLGLSLRNAVLLGYDPGLYKAVFDAYIHALPNVPETTLPHWMRQVYEQGLPMLTTHLHVMAGVSPDGFLRYFLPAISAAVVLPLYLVTKDAFGRRAALLTALLYAVSYTQLFTFGLMYLKNVVALFLLLLALHALQHRRLWLFGLLLGGVGLYHRPTFLVAALILVAYLLVTRQREVLPPIGLAGLMVVPLLLLRWQENWALVQGALAGSASVASGGTAAGGTFMEISQYQLASLGYQPFALVAVMYLVARRQWPLPLLWMVACAALVGFQLFFFKRDLIPLDLAMLMLAGKGLDLTFFTGRQGAWTLLSGGLVLLLLIGISVPSWRYTQEAHPMLTPEQLAAIEWINQETPAGAVVLASAYDAPWVAGWSGRDVIAPGQFDLSPQSQDQWLAFLQSDNAQAAASFLSSYGQPALYVYDSGDPNSYMAIGKFQGPFFKLVHTEGPAQIWQLTSSAGLSEAQK